MSENNEKKFIIIQNAITQGIREFLVAFENNWPNETMYAFLLEVSCEGTSLEAVAATEEGLTRIAKKYAESYFNELQINEKRIELRWGSPEDGWYPSYNGNYFNYANQLLIDAHNDQLMELYDGKLNQLALNVLHKLDMQGLFGHMKIRQQRAIGICYVGGDNSDEEFLHWLRVINSIDVVERVKREMAARNEIYIKSHKT
ncbi:hypothetical protein C7H19_11705 [Aphanothece hegewaldii CCALA 016]|uniref:DUF4303 domain-containing protein n=1 Tax=Aphanothece hegewaldii CCALA 016 TaxID=2107694 RepID=A0A2T1LXL5_9CHRO|nr:DUF4303 domain-containing protein [Aphanothece hegewaldii]PSF37098.1 hypothetical protein C7H19_11705 [Aphanothece hegewaldii CCALA 016]